MSALKRLGCLGLVGFLLLLPIGAASSPDPAGILQAVYSRRIKLPPSRFEISMRMETGLNTNTMSYIVEFDGEKRRFIKTPEGTNNIGSLYNGKDVIRNDGSSIIITDIKDSNSEFLFDPRILGITTSYSQVERLSVSLPFKENKSIELLEETLNQNGERTWHIKAVDPFGQIKNYWINNKFQVTRFDFNLPGGPTNSTWSVYGHSKLPHLPSKVETIENEQNGKVRSQTLVTVTKLEQNIKIPKETWALAGMKPLLGSPVSDVRQKLRLGYWNGGGLSPSINLEPAPGRTPIGVYLLVIISATLITFLFFRWKKA